MKALTIKVPVSLHALILKLARARGSTVSAVVRDAIERHVPADKPSFAEVANAWVGCLDGGPGDLATNPKYLGRLGR